VNVVFKILLMAPLAQAGLALATSIGAWLNFALVAWFAARQGHLAIGPRLRASGARLAAAGCLLAIVLWLATGGIGRVWPTAAPMRDVATLAALAALGAIVYGGALAILFGKEWLAGRDRGRSKK
jgi:putative peptidoglycan lipid II flippase